MKFHSKVGSFLVLGIFAVIILSFVLTGFQSNIQFLGTGNGVATVDGNTVKFDDYQRALSRQLKFYEQMFGGKALNAQQIEQFGVKRTVLKRLIDQKLIENLAEDLSIGVSKKEVVNEIEKMPYFSKNGGFDLITYKRLLELNGFSTETFEENVKTDLKVRKIEKIINNTNYVSTGFTKFYTEVKDKNLTSYAVRFSKESLRSKLEIPSKEVTAYLSDKANLENIKKEYDSKKYLYQTKEQVRASHILIKAPENDEKAQAAALKKIQEIQKGLTAKNFAAKAKEHSQDSSASKGGDLNFFGKGQMVPPFEKMAFSLAKGKVSEPVKSKFGYHLILVTDKKAANNKSFDSVKSDLAKDALRKSKNKELDDFFKSVVADINKSFEKNSFSSVKSLKDKYGITYLEKNTDLNLIDQRLESIPLSDKEVGEIFNDVTKDNLFDFSTESEAKIIKTLKYAKVEDKKVDEKKKLEEEYKTQKQDYQSKFRTKLVKFLTDNAKVVTYPKFL